LHEASWHGGWDPSKPHDGIADDDVPVLSLNRGAFPRGIARRQPKLDFPATGGALAVHTVRIGVAIRLGLRAVEIKSPWT
jgi:hypothetical protein